MKKVDIQPGVEYVMSSDQDHYRYLGAGTRVRVIEHIEVPRQAWSRRGSSVPGVLVQLLDRETGEPMTRPVLNDEMEVTGEIKLVDHQKVSNRNIKEPWSTFEAHIKADKEAQDVYAVSKAKAEAKQAVINTQIMEGLRAAVPELNKHGYGAPYISEYTIRDFLLGKVTKLELDGETLAAIFGVEA